MTLTPDLETLFRVTAHPLTKGMFVKYEPDWTKGREYIIRTKIFRIILL